LEAAVARFQLAGIGRAAVSRWGVAFALAGVVGVVLRVWIYRSVMGTPNPDEAVIGLMARHCSSVCASRGRRSP